MRCVASISVCCKATTSFSSASIAASSNRASGASISWCSCSTRVCADRSAVSAEESDVASWSRRSVRCCRRSSVSRSSPTSVANVEEISRALEVIWVSRASRSSSCYE